MVDRVRSGVLSASAELPHYDLHFNKYAQQILDNGKSVAPSTPTITTLSGSEFLQKLSASFVNHFETRVLNKNEHLAGTFTTPRTAIISSVSRGSPHPMESLSMDFDIVPNQVTIGSSDFDAMDELQKQLEYDKFMNEVWIGIVFTLVLISMVFCICSCFLYHQFRTWKRNYNLSVEQSQALDIESMKLNPDPEDPVPEYTLVSGLPSYEAALELLHKTPNSCVLMYPPLFGVFNKCEKSALNMTDVMASITMPPQQQQQQFSSNDSAASRLMSTDVTVKSLTPFYSSNNKSNTQLQSYADATTIALTTTNTATSTTSKTTPTTIVAMPSVNEKSEKRLTSFEEIATSAEMMSTTTTTTTTSPLIPAPTPTSSSVILQKVPSYEEALLVKTDSLL